MAIIKRTKFACPIVNNNSLCKLYQRYCINCIFFIMIYLLEGIIFFEREREEFVLRDFSNYFENCNKYINMKVSNDRNNRGKKKLWMKEKIQKVINRETTTFHNYYFCQKARK